LTLPAYRVNEAARYARVTPQTIRNWQTKGNGGKSAVVIKDARDFIAQRLNSEFPFVENRFKVQGARILMNLTQFEPGAPGNKLVVVSHGGQLEWGEMLGRKFEEFDYKKGLAVRWHLAGRGSPILIDPQIAFGAPQINGVPTWAIIGRQRAGESLADIADDGGHPGAHGVRGNHSHAIAIPISPGRLKVDGA
jgi:hypothetical protein